MVNEEYFSSPSGYRIQKTLKTAVDIEGIGLHSGAPARLRLLPASPNHGIVFVRADLVGRPKIFAHYDAVVCTALATSLGLRDWEEARVSTVEHLMAALFALGVTNVIAEISGPEVPILDGSAGPFIEAILDAGIELQPFTTPVLKVLKPIKIYENGAICELLPRAELRLTTSIDFQHPSIGLQTFAIELTPQSFRDEICNARTFGFLRDVEKLKAKQLAQGASLANVLAFSEDGVLNPEGMRYLDECVRHKMLDAIGDLALCGSWIQGELVSFRGGHAIHFALLKALRTHASNWELVKAEPIGLGTGRELSSRPRIAASLPTW